MCEECLCVNVSGDPVSGARNREWRIRLVQRCAEPDLGVYQSGCAKRRADGNYWAGWRRQGLCFDDFLAQLRLTIAVEPPFGDHWRHAPD